jgi:ABC-type cobalamin/Fe3+-siderophores transport system ATPase subunit
VKEAATVGCFPKKRAGRNMRLVENFVAEALTVLQMSEFAERNIPTLSGAKEMAFFSRAIAQRLKQLYWMNQ